MTKQSALGTSPMFLLFLTFLVLRLTDVLAWSWWWVASPLWVVALLFLVIRVLEKLEKMA